MEDRLNRILDHYKLTPAQLADSISVQRSSISHILSGRNKPSYDFLVKILTKYKQINANWLLSGQGSMLSISQNANKDNNQSPEPELFSNINQSFDKKGITSDNQPDSKSLEVIDDSFKSQQNTPSNKEFTNVNKIKSIILIYSDNTFEVINKK